MKKTLICACALACALTGLAQRSQVFDTVTISTGGTEEQVACSSGCDIVDADNELLVTCVTFWADPDNTTAILVGTDTSLDQASDDAVEIPAGESWQVGCGDNRRVFWDLNDYYVVSATTSDAVDIIYEAR